MVFMTQLLLAQPSMFICIFLRTFLLRPIAMRMPIGHRIAQHGMYYHVRTSTCTCAIIAFFGANSFVVFTRQTLRPHMSCEHQRAYGTRDAHAQQVHDHLDGRACVRWVPSHPMQAERQHRTSDDRRDHDEEERSRDRDGVALGITKQRDARIAGHHHDQRDAKRHPHLRQNVVTPSPRAHLARRQSTDDEHRSLVSCVAASSH